MEKNFVLLRSLDESVSALVIKEFDRATRSLGPGHD
jgi:hypothetical protein